MANQPVLDMPAITREVTERKVVGIVAAILGGSTSALDLASSFKELGADPVDIYFLKMQIDRMLGVPVSEREAERFVTVGDAVKYVIGHTGH
jgi:acyl carrier protein